MMANAQKMIEERKRALSLKTGTPVADGKPIKILGAPPARYPSVGLLPDDKTSRIAQLQVCETLLPF